MQDGRQHLGAGITLRVLCPLPSHDFDPTEAAIPWAALGAAGHTVTFSTPNGAPAAADPRMVTGEGLGLLKPVLQADKAGRTAYAAMVASPGFQRPLAWAETVALDFDALLLPGGHAKGMREVLEAGVVQAMVVAFFQADRPVAAICHGTLLAARSTDPETGRSVLHGRKTTGLTRSQELAAWALTAAWLGDYYRTYPEPMETELRRQLAAPTDYDPGPLPLRRDSVGNLAPGFTVRDRNYLSARWPGDAHRFAAEFVAMLGEQRLRAWGRS